MSEHIRAPAEMMPPPPPSNKRARKRAEDASQEKRMRQEDMVESERHNATVENVDVYGAGLVIELKVDDSDAMVSRGGCYEADKSKHHRRFVFHQFTKHVILGGIQLGTCFNTTQSFEGGWSGCIQVYSGRGWRSISLIEGTAGTSTYKRLDFDIAPIKTFIKDHFGAD
jgi:hypothetical protein